MVYRRFPVPERSPRPASHLPAGTTSPRTTLRRAGAPSALGGVTCWNIDVDAWKLENTVPMFDNRYNMWVVRVQTEEAISSEEAKNRVRSQFEGWINTWFGSETGYVEQIDYGEPFQSVDQFEQKYGINSAVRDARWTQNPTITWQPSNNPPWFVEVVFVYRGGDKEFAWPTYRSSIGAFCPKDVEVGVERVYEPLKERPAKEDPCNARGAWKDNPACAPFLLSPDKWFSPMEWPWWAWLAVGGGALYLAGPLLLPLAGGAVRATKGVVSGAAKAVSETAADDEKKDEKADDKKGEEATPNRRRRRRALETAKRRSR